MTAYADETGLQANIEALKSPNWATSKAAADALVALGSLAVPALSKVLLDNESPSEGRRRAAIALGRVGTDDAFQPLDRALDDDDWLIRFGAACGLAEVPDTTAVEARIDALIHASHDAVVNIASVAIHAFRRIGEPAVLPLLALLQRGDYPRRSWVASELAWLRDTRAAAPLIAALRDPDAALRAAAAETLGVVGSGQAQDALIGALDDDDPDVRANAASSLGLLGEERALPKLRWMAEHDEGETWESDPVRDFAQEAINLIVDKQGNGDSASF